MKHKTIVLSALMSLSLSSFAQTTAEAFFKDRKSACRERVCLYV